MWLLLAPHAGNHPSFYNPVWSHSAACLLQQLEAPNFGRSLWIWPYSCSWPRWQQWNCLRLIVFHAKNFNNADIGWQLAPRSPHCPHSAQNAYTSLCFQVVSPGGARLGWPHCCNLWCCMYFYPFFPATTHHFDGKHEALANRIKYASFAGFIEGAARRQGNPISIFICQAATKRRIRNLSSILLAFCCAPFRFVSFWLGSVRFGCKFNLL